MCILILRTITLKEVLIYFLGLRNEIISLFFGPVLFLASYWLADRVGPLPRRHYSDICWDQLVQWVEPDRLSTYSDPLPFFLYGPATEDSCCLGKYLTTPQNIYKHTKCHLDDYTQINHLIIKICSTNIIIRLIKTICRFYLHNSLINKAKI